MKKLKFEKTIDPKKRHKSISLSQVTEDKESVTRVVKGFEYKIVRTPQTKLKQEAPEVWIKKGVNSPKNTEFFDFKVEGYFYFVNDRMIYKVLFKHTLNIEIKWKKIFSPKKSVVLTK